MAIMPSVVPVIEKVEEPAGEDEQVRRHSKDMRAVCCARRKKPATTGKPQRATPLGVRHHLCSTVSSILASIERLRCLAGHRHIGLMAGMSSSSAAFFWTSVKIAYRPLVAADVALMASSRAVSFFTS